MCPHSNHFNDALLRKNLVDESMLNVYSSGVGSEKVTDELLIWRGCLKGIDLENLEKSLGLGL